MHTHACLGQLRCHEVDLDFFPALKVQGLEFRYSEEERFLLPSTERSPGPCFSGRLSQGSEEEALAVRPLVLNLSTAKSELGNLGESLGFWEAQLRHLYQNEEWAGLGGKNKNTTARSPNVGIPQIPKF